MKPLSHENVRFAWQATLVDPRGDVVLPKISKIGNFSRVS